jgi:hypothetical protein
MLHNLLFIKQIWFLKKIMASWLSIAESLGNEKIANLLKAAGAL